MVDILIPASEEQNNIEIGGIAFTAEELTPEQSQGSRDVTVTKIFNGTCFVTQGEYLPMIWSFKTHLYYKTGDEWNPLIRHLESEPQEIVSPLIGEIFTGIVRITRTPVSPELMQLEFKITEAPDISNYTVDNSLYKQKHLSIQEVHDGG